MTAHHPADALPFLKLRRPKGTGINYWDVTPTGSYGEDCNTGHALAEEYLAYIGANPTVGNGTLLTCIVHEMIDQAKDGQPWSGVHVGFLAGVNGYAMATARALTPPHRPRPKRSTLRLVRGTEEVRS